MEIIIVYSSMMMIKTTVIVWAYILNLIFLFNVDNFTLYQRLRLYSSAGPQISEVGLLGSNLGRVERFASLMCIMCTCTMLQSVQRRGRGIHSPTDGTMFYK